MIIGIMLDHFRIILLKTSHPGNIGAAARAMKTMGLSTLYLVAPMHFPHPKAEEMASGAGDVLSQAVVVPTLEEAIADCHLIVGASARERTIPWPMLTPREFAEKAHGEGAAHHRIAVLFGPEQSGLTNDELHRCHFHVHIPSNPDYNSLNVAAAVQVIGYELRMAGLSIPNTQAWDVEYAVENDIQGFLQHLEKVLVQIDFLNPAVPRQLMPRLHRLFKRARLDTMEVNILRGILTAIEKRSAVHHSGDEL